MDMLNELIHEQGSGGRTCVPLMKERAVPGLTVAAIASARAASLSVGYVRIGFSL
jgi:hypothetical protein